MDRKEKEEKRLTIPQLVYEKENRSKNGWHCFKHGKGKGYIFIIGGAHFGK